MLDYVDIVGIRWTIKEDKDVVHASGNFGETHFKSNTIYIDPDQSEQNKRDTLWHEIMHAALWVTGMEMRMRNKENIPTEEELVRALSTVQLQVLRENPGLVEYLTLNKL
jgi:hypothetical protein